MARPKGGTGATLDDAVDELQKLVELTEVSNDIQTGIQAILTGGRASIPRPPTAGGDPTPPPLPTPTGRMPTGGGSGGSGSGGSGGSGGFFRRHIHRFKEWRSKARGGAYKGARAAGMGRKGAVGLGRAAGVAGGVAAVVVGVVTAFDEARKAVTKWTDEAMKTAQQLAKFSGSMAVVMAERDIQEMQRQIRRGEATAGTTRGLVQAESRRKEQELKIDIAIDNLKNTFLTVANDLLADVLKPIADGVTYIAKEVFGLKGKDDIVGGLGGALLNIEAENNKINAAGKTLMDIARAAAMGGGAAPAGAGAIGKPVMGPGVLP